MTNDSYAKTNQGDKVLPYVVPQHNVRVQSFLFAVEIILGLLYIALMVKKIYPMYDSLPQIV